MSRQRNGGVHQVHGDDGHRDDAWGLRTECLAVAGGRAGGADEPTMATVLTAVTRRSDGSSR